MPFHELAEELDTLHLLLAEETSERLFAHEECRRNRLDRFVVGCLEDDEGTAARDAQIDCYHAVSEPIAVNAAGARRAEGLQHRPVEAALCVVGVYGRAA